jgi:2-isopropylmalate synthase
MVAPEVYHLEDFQVTSGTRVEPSAAVKLKKNKKVYEASSKGDGPVDACYKAIDKIAGIKGKLLDYGIRSVTSGKDALGEVSIRVLVGKMEVSGRGASTDIIEASIKAYLNAINKIAAKTQTPGAKVEL